MAITLLTGNKPEDEDDLVDKVIQFERSVAIFSTTGMELDFFPLLRYFGHPQYKKLSKACRLHSEFWEEMWAGHEKAPPPSDVDPDNTYFINSASQLIDPKSNKFQPQVNRDNIKYSVINIIVGSVSTTANSIYGLINILLHYPQVYKRLQQEVRMFTFIQIMSVILLKIRLLHLVEYFPKSMHAIRNIICFRLIQCWERAAPRQI